MLKKIVYSVLFLFSSLIFAQTVEDISQQAVLDLIQHKSTTDFVILDVRTAEEYQAAHIPGAINISHNLVSKNIDKLSQYKDKLVIVHCRSGRRAAFAEKILTKAGFSHLRHLAGDMNGWQEANLPLE